MKKEISWMLEQTREVLPMRQRRSTDVWNRKIGGSYHLLFTFSFESDFPNSHLLENSVGGPLI